MRRSTIILGILGVVLLALAILTKFVVVPTASKLPDDVDATAYYAGKATILNSEALQAGDTANALLPNLDVTIDRHVYVSSVDGDTAVVHDDSTVKVAGQTIEDPHAFAIDRTTMESAPAPDGAAVEAHSGITVTLPIGPSQDDSYQLYDSAARTTAALDYIGEDARGGRDVNYYQSTVAGPLKNEGLLKSFPPSLPSALAAGLLPLLPADTQQALQDAGPLPETILLSYTTRTAYDVWVDSQLGAVLDTTIHRVITANADLGGKTIPLLPVLDIDVKQTPDSVASGADDAAKAGRLLSILSIWVPLVLLIAGLVLIILALLRQRRARVSA